MVSTSESNEKTTNGSEVTGLPAGRYRLVSWDADISGRRLIDEICQIAAYTPSSQFAQYIMPFSDLSVVARRRHNIRVVTLGLYRMLKDSKTNKVLKTKSEISALTDFLVWLEEIKGDATDGIVLMHHEARKAIPLMLLESLRRYNLLERFESVVKGFANSYKIAEDKCAKTVKSFSLRVLSRVLLDKEAELDNAAERARLTYEVIEHLSLGERQDLSSEGSGDVSTNDSCMIEVVRPFAQSLEMELNELSSFKEMLERQNTFRPVFGALLRASRVERFHASHLRRLLAENNVDYTVLEEAWKKSNRDGLSEVLKEQVLNANEKEIEELLDILDCHFNPEKKPVEPKPRNARTPRKHSGGSKRTSESGNSTNVKTIETSSKGDSSTETTGNAYSDVGSQLSSDNTPRSQTDELEPTESK